MRRNGFRIYKISAYTTLTPIFQPLYDTKLKHHPGAIGCANSAYTIASRLVNGIGIMDDGTPISYDK